MPITFRIVGAVLLLAVAGICAFLAVAAREAPREAWWAFWMIEGTVGLLSAIGAAWLLCAKRARI